jgi:chemotaxis methyl-accepting protein methylase
MTIAKRLIILLAVRLAGIELSERHREVLACKIRRLAPAIRPLGVFQPFNLIDPVWPIDGQFDMIFCRNVLIQLVRARAGTSFRCGQR